MAINRLTVWHTVIINLHVAGALQVSVHILACSAHCWHLSRTTIDDERRSPFFGFSELSSTRINEHMNLVGESVVGTGDGVRHCTRHNGVPVLVKRVVTGSTKQQ